MSAIDTLRGALGDPNVQAFARVVRQGESHVSSPLAYQALFGWHPVKNPGQIFTDFADHPRQAFQTKWGWTSASGAYQAMCVVPGKVKTDTWGDFVRWCARENYRPSFSPTDQDLFFAWCLQRRKALDDVIAGRFGDAIDKCNEEWASLPGAPYGQPVMTMDEARKTFTTWGGVIREGHVSPRPMPAPAPPAPPAPAAAPTPAPIPAGEAPDYSAEATVMNPFLLAAIPKFLEHAPDLIRIFGSGERSEKNAKAVEVVAEIAKTVTNERTVEGAAQALDTDAAAGPAFREAVHQSMTTGELLPLLLKAGQADEQSRVAALDRNLQLSKATGGRWLWLVGAVVLIMIVMGYVITTGIIFGWGKVKFSDDLRAMMIGQVVIFGFSTAVIFMLGTNLQNRIDQRNREQQQG